MRTLVPRMAASIPQSEPGFCADDGSVDRDTVLAARSRARRPVQRGLFDRRAVREAEETRADETGAGPQVIEPGGSGCVPGTCSAQAPQPVLLLFVTS